MKVNRKTYRTKLNKKIAAMGAVVLLSVTALSVTGMASDFNMGYNAKASDNDYLSTTKAPSGKIGKSMSISFRIRAGSEDMKNLKVSLMETSDFQVIEQKGGGDYTVDYYPFEIMETTFVAKSLGDIKKGSTKSVSLSATVRKDVKQGYYSIPIYLEWDGGNDIDYINIWISADSSTGTDNEEDKKEGTYFVIGENQSTPRGVYPNVMDYTVNFRNRRSTTVQDVTVHMELSEDNAKFPFEINDGNYDRTFSRIQPEETVSASYSMAIRKDSYTGYYPVKYTITFRLSSEGDLRTEEGTFFVHIVSKDKGDDLREFAANDRTKARLIVDSYYTIPEEVYAGDGFELVLNMKNASSSVPASNILFNLESEKVSESAVFTTETGSSSLVVNSLGAGETTELRAKFSAKAGVDQRSYAITIKEKYDSPEFKNAEESIVVDIPVKQYAKLSTSNIEVMPDTMAVGSESNVMFGINNTGKVILYNVTVAFEGDSIKPTDTYVGNIKPGETGSVDSMLYGVSPTADDGRIKIKITYEDENGVAAEPVEKELTLMVTESMDMEAGGDMEKGLEAGVMDMEPQPSLWSRYKVLVIVLVLACAGAGILIALRMKNRQKAETEEDLDDEIS